MFSIFATKRVAATWNGRALSNLAVMCERQVARVAPGDVRVILSESFGSPAFPIRSRPTGVRSCGLVDGNAR